MVNPSVVNALQASSHYIQNMPNLLTGFCTASYLAGRILPLFGKNIPPVFDKLSGMSVQCFLIPEIGKFLSSPVNFAKDASVAYSVIRKGTGVDRVRADQQGDFPRTDNSLCVTPAAWAIYRLAASAFKFLSGGAFIYSLLRHEVKLNPYYEMVGVGLGAIANGIDIFDSYSKMKDLNADITVLKNTKGQNEIPAEAMLKPRLDSTGSRENAVQDEDKELFRAYMPRDLKGSMALSALFFMMKAVSFTLVLNKIVRSDALFGRVTHFVKANKKDIWGALFVATSTATVAKHIIWGATLQELTKRNIKKT